MRQLAFPLLVVFAAQAMGAEALPPPPPPPPPAPVVEGTTAAPADQPAPPPVVEAQEKGHSDWARPAAFIGFGVGGAVLVTSIIAEVIGATSFHADYYDPGNALMLVPLVLTAAGGPIVFIGGRSARWTGSITGSKAFRIVGWITYGVGLALELAAAAVTYGTGLRTVAGTVGAGSLVCFGLDALYSASDAADVASEATRDDGLRFGPTLSLVRGVNGNGPAPVFGMAGAF